MGQRRSLNRTLKNICSQVKIKLGLTKIWGMQQRLCRGKFMALNVHTRKEEKSEINNLRFQLWKLEKEQQYKPKYSRI